jgi:hypothetical protein
MKRDFPDGGRRRATAREAERQGDREAGRQRDTGVGCGDVYSVYAERGVLVLYKVCRSAKWKSRKQEPEGELDASGDGGRRRASNHSKGLKAVEKREEKGEGEV